METILENNGLKGRGLTWEQLGMEAGIEASKMTFKNIMGSIDYHKCLACRRGWQSPRSCANRVEYARIMLEKNPVPEDWDQVRWTDKVQFGRGAQLQLRIIRNPAKDIVLTVFNIVKSPKLRTKMFPLLGSCGV